MSSRFVRLLPSLLLVPLACHKSHNTAPPVVQPATLEVATFLEDGVTPAGAGVLVQAGNGLVATTGAAGTASLTLGAGAYTVECLDPFLEGAAVDVSVVAGEQKQLQVTLQDEGCVRTVELQIGGLAGGVVPGTLQDFRLSFVDQGTPVPVDAVGRVELRSAISNHSVEASDLFQVADGALVPIDVQALLTELTTFSGAIVAEVAATDAVGHRVEGQREFYLGQYEVHGSLLALATVPNVPVAQIEVTARILGSSLSFTTTTDAAGAFQFASVPSGQIELFAQSELLGSFWTGFGVMSVSANHDITLTLLGVPEILAGQASLAVLTDAGTAPEVDPVVQQQRREGARWLPARDAGGGTDDATATATGGARDARMAGSATLTIPQGTTKVVLRYHVSTAEYPVWVLQQSIFNDVWELRVLGANGALKYAITRRVNEQLQMPPVWQPNGDTGIITEDLDVTALAAAGPADVIVAVASTNIGDNLFPTTVSATLTTQTEFRIRASQPIGAYAISIPAAGATNVLQKSYAIDYDRPTDVQLTEYQVQILADDTEVVLHDFGRRAAPAETPLPKGHRIEVPVTFAAGTPSTVATVPPPADMIRYRFTLFGIQNATEVHSDTKSSPKMRALWHMPANLPRYSCRDEGDDDWCSRRTYDVLLANTALFPAINDISGEHGRNIGHQTHKDGFDLDVYHFTELDGGSGPCRPLGTTNFKALRAKVNAAFGTGATAEEALDIVRFWFESERSGLAALAALSQVDRILVAHGIAEGEAKKGYYRDLLFTGVTTSASGAVLDLQIGAWSNDEVVSDASLRHEHHNHVDIVK